MRFCLVIWRIHLLHSIMSQASFTWAEAQKSMELGHPVTLPVSDELYLLMRYRWLVLANQSNITYHTDLKWDTHYRRLMNTFDYERELFDVDPRLKELRDLKEKYVSFNTRYAGQPMAAAEELDKLIAYYCSCGETIFQSFAALLKRYREPIINSFIMVEKCGPGGLYDSRLSNGPIESLNRKVKDLKRMSRSFRSFEHFRNRFLYATRSNPVLNGTADPVLVQYFENDPS